jgi:hypothetical protein
VSVRLIVAALVAACLSVAPPVVARGGGSAHAATSSTHSTASSHGSGSARSSTSSHSSSSRSGTWSHSKAAPWVHRDSHGKIARDPRASSSFKKQHPCPSTGKAYGSCPGYTVDHVVPLKRGGADAPHNMQWQTNEAAKQKDKWE